MPYMTIYTTGADMIEIAPFIEECKWSENDLDSQNAGRTLDGLMHRGKVASKRRADLKLINLSAAQINPIFEVIRKEYFYCDTDLVPAEGPLSMQMYNSTRSGGIQIVNTDNVVMHKDVAFNIIER